jgi:hypothetical protein
MVIDPVVPSTSVVDEAPETATRTLLNCTFSMMRLFAVGGVEVELLFVAIPTPPAGVFVNTLSMMVKDPTESEVISMPIQGVSMGF